VDSVVVAAVAVVAIMAKAMAAVVAAVAAAAAGSLFVSNPERVVALSGPFSFRRPRRVIPS